MSAKRGRKSSAELSVISINSKRKPIDPPAELSPEERAIWWEITESVAPNHLRDSDRPILSALCTAIHLSRFYAREIGGEDASAFKSYTEATKLVISLTTKLRLTPQSRSRPETVARHEGRRRGSAPWEQ